jgi:hypothetical protein
LLCLASLDFLNVTMHGRFMGRYVSLGGLGNTVILLLVHLLTVGVLVRQDRLCVGRGVEWHDM